MKSIGVRELRQHASKYLREVEQGERFEVTDRGKPVAHLIPLPRTESVVDRLIAEGRMSPGGGGDILDIKPLPAEPGKPTLSEILEEMRADER